VLSEVSEHQTRARHEILDGRGRHDFPGASQRGDPGGRVHGDPRDVLVAELDLARVQTCPELNPDRADRLARLERTSDGLAGPSNVTKNPSPAVSISRPRYCAISLRTIARCSSRSEAHARSPIVRARSVDPTMSGDQYGRQHAVVLGSRANPG
jgi:hypothetical protein